MLHNLCSIEFSSWSFIKNIIGANQTLISKFHYFVSGIKILSRNEPPGRPWSIYFQPIMNKARAFIKKVPFQLLQKSIIFVQLFKFIWFCVLTSVQRTIHRLETYIYRFSGLFRRTPGLNQRLAEELTPKLGRSKLKIKFLISFSLKMIH